MNDIERGGWILMALSVTLLILTLASIIGRFLK